MKAGDPVPDFSVKSDSGETVRLSEVLEKGPVVLFFYPRAMTAGCTKESCHFRDLRGEFEDLRVSVFGISADSVERQGEFKRRHDFGFPLLSDPDREVARLFGVRRPGPLWNRRMTFVIGADSHVLDVIQSETNMELHADRALKALRER